MNSSWLPPPELVKLLELAAVAGFAAGLADAFLGRGREDEAGLGLDCEPRPPTMATSSLTMPLTASA